MALSLSTSALSIRANDAHSRRALQSRAVMPRGCASKPLVVACSQEQVAFDVRRKVIASVAALTVAAGCQFGSIAEAAETSKSRGVANSVGISAVAELVAAPGYSVTGTVKITEVTNKYGRPFTKIAVEGSGFTAGTHGINIHEEGTPGLKSYNPDGRPHGSPTSIKGFGASVGHYLGDGSLFWRHVGDVGNVKANEDGVISMVLNEELTKISGEFDVTGKCIVIHAAADDFETEKDDGNAGPIIAYGTIKRI